MKSNRFQLQAIIHLQRLIHWQEVTIRNRRKFRSVPAFAGGLCLFLALCSLEAHAQQITLNFNDGLLPSATGWTFQGQDHFNQPLSESQVASVSGGILHFDTMQFGSGSDDALAYWRIPINSIDPVNYEYEIRMRAIAPNSFRSCFGGLLGAGIEVRGNFDSDLTAMQPQLHMGGFSAASSSDPCFLFNLDASVFHTYKIVVQNNDQGTLYVDGVQVAQGVLIRPNTLSLEAVFGDLTTSGGNATADIEYIRVASLTQPVASYVPTTLSAQAIAVDSIRNRIFVVQDDSSGRPDFEVVVLDGASQATLATIPITATFGQYGIAVNEITGRVYVANGFGLVVIDANRLSVISTIGLPFGCTAVAVNPLTNRIYANGPFNRLNAIDGSSEQVVASLFLSSIPRDIEVDPLRNRIYATHESAGFFSVIDGATNSLLTTVPIAGRILAMAVDPDLGQLYFAQHTLSPPANLFILDSDSLATLASRPIGPRTEGVAVDRFTHRVYTGSGNPTPFQGVTVLDGAARIIINFIPTSHPVGRPVAVNSTTRRIYIPSGEVEPSSVVVVIQDTLPPPDLAITQSATPSTVVTGSNITYTLTVTNNSPGGATEVTVTDTLPPETSFVSCASADGICSGSGNQRTITFASLAANASTTITLVAQVNCSVADHTVINNTATVSASTPDADPGNNSATAAVTASNPPPAMTCPSNITASNDAGQCGAVVNYAAPTVSDNCAGAGPAVCSPATGSFFPKGTTTVNCTVTDAGGNASSCAFTVTVLDAQAPTITACATNKTLSTNGGNQIALPDLAGEVTATDNCPGSLSITQSPAAGTMVSIGNTAVTITVTDAANNQATCTATVTVVKFLIKDFVAFSSEHTKLLANARVNTGNVGANSSLPDPNGPPDDKEEVEIGERAQMLQAGSSVVGDTVRLRANAQVYNVHFNESFFSNNATILGNQVTPQPLPLLTMPMLPTITPGTTDIEVGTNQTLTLAPGSYRKITVKTKGTLILSGGIYHVSSLDIRQEARLFFLAPSEVRVKNELDTDAKTVIGPDPSVPALQASQIIFYVEGGDDNGGGDENLATTAVQIGERNTVTANVYAPNGTVWLKANTTATGAFIGKQAKIGERVELTLKSAF
jgi:uncharacterized repeat protein (TIGR01451 family)